MSDGRLESVLGYLFTDDARSERHEIGKNDRIEYDVLVEGTRDIF